MTATGIVLILGAAVGASLLLTREARVRLSELEAVISLIAFIRQNIDTFASPVDTIASSWSCSVKGAKHFSDAVRKDGLKAAVYGGHVSLSADARNDIETFAENIGKGYRDEEVKRCEYYLARFEGYLASARESFERCRPLYRYVPFVCAASIIIIAL